MHSRLHELILKLKAQNCELAFKFIQGRIGNIQTMHEIQQLSAKLKENLNKQAYLKKEITLIEQVHNSIKNLDIKIYYALDDKINVSFNLYSDCESQHLKECLPVGYFSNSIAAVEAKRLPLVDPKFLYTLTFQLPHSPHLFLSWLSYISFYFLEIHLFKFSKIFISSEDQEDIASIDPLSQLLDCIFSLARKKPLYEPVLKALQNIENENIDSLFFDYQLKSSPGNASNISRAARVTTLCTLSRELITSGQKSALNTYFYWLDRYVKFELYASAQNKLTPDGKPYGFQNQQWQLLKFADFRYIDNTICIVNIPNNDAYKVLYADNCVLNNQYEKNVYNLLEMLDLEFEPQSDLRSHIIFKPQSTRNLLSSGFCLKDECQKEIYKENNWKLFSDKIENKNERMAPWFCPKVIVEEIFEMVRLSK